MNQNFEEAGNALEEGNEVIWLDWVSAVSILYHPHHQWAVECAADILLGKECEKNVRL